MRSSDMNELKRVLSAIFNKEFSDEDIMRLANYIKGNKANEGWLVRNNRGGLIPDGYFTAYIVTELISEINKLKKRICELENKTRYEVC